MHLLVLDRGRDEIAASMQLIAGRTRQRFNQRKGRRGFVDEVQRNLDLRARYRQIAEADGVSVLRDAEEAYGPISRSKWAA